MAYLGNDLQVAYPTYKNIDDISGSFNSSATSFPLLVSGVAPVPLPLNSQQCLISVGGVVQRPDDSGSEGFRLSGGNIIFASAPATGADFFGVILAGADYVNVGANYPSGSAAVPSITFDSDLDTGIYNSAANELSFSTGGTQRLSISSAGQLSNNLGSAAAPSYSFSGDVNTGIYSPGADQVAISTGGSGRVFINADGLGIGVSSPTNKLQISGATANALLNGTSNSYIGCDVNSSNVGFVGDANWMFGGSSTNFGLRATNNLVFGIGLNERMRLDSSGRLGIGSNNPQSKLAVFGTADNEEIFHVANTAGTTDGSATNRLRFTCNGNGAWANVRYNAFQHIWGSSALADSTERMRIDSSGRLLVGTSSVRNAGNASQSSRSPLYFIEGAGANAYSLFTGILGRADVNGPNFTFAKTRSNSPGDNTIVQNGDVLGQFFFAGADGTDLNSIGASIQAEVDGTPGVDDMPGRLVFSTTADGASSPTERLRINSLGVTQSDSTSWNFVCLRPSGANQGHIQFQNGGVQVGSIASSTTTTTYATSSDYRLKENVAKVTDGINRLQQLKPSRFNFIAAPNVAVDGFIAHEVQAVVPEAIIGEKDAVDADGNPIYQGIDQSKLVPLLTAALQEAVAKIESLEARLTAAGI